MPNDSHFHPLPSVRADQVIIRVNGETVRASAHWTVAAALLANGYIVFRESAIDHAPRGPFCMMGACFECLVQIDGKPHQQACMTPVAPGMRIEIPRTTGERR